MTFSEMSFQMTEETAGCTIKYATLQNVKLYVFCIHTVPLNHIQLVTHKLIISGTLRPYRTLFWPAF